MNKLPEKGWQILKLAIVDFKKTINQNFEINMSCFGQGRLTDNPSKCSVCLAGAVMLQTTKIGKHPSNFHETLHVDGNMHKYHFLNNIRKGELYKAFLYLKKGNVDINLQTFLENHRKKLNWIVYSKKDEKVFIKQLEELIIVFKKQNI